jgi:hypothetical protein
MVRVDWEWSHSKQNRLASLRVLETRHEAPVRYVAFTSSQ